MTGSRDRMEKKSIQTLLQQLETCVRTTDVFWDGIPAQEYRGVMQELIFEMRTMMEEKDES